MDNNGNLQTLDRLTVYNTLLGIESKNARYNQGLTSQEMLFLLYTIIEKLEKIEERLDKDGTK